MGLLLPAAVNEIVNVYRLIVRDQREMFLTPVEFAEQFTPEEFHDRGEFVWEISPGESSVMNTAASLAKTMITDVLAEDGHTFPIQVADAEYDREAGAKWEYIDRQLTEAFARSADVNLDTKNADSWQQWVRWDKFRGFIVSATRYVHEALDLKFMDETESKAGLQRLAALATEYETFLVRQGK